MTENEKRKEGDDLMTCFVIHVSLLSLHICLETEKIVIQVTSSDEDTDTATECSDYSDTADEECLC